MLPNDDFTCAKSLGFALREGKMQTVAPPVVTRNMALGKLLHSFG